MENRQYRQCEMHKALNGTAVARHVAYIPSDKAKIGKTINLPEPWGDGWIVDSIGPVREFEDVDRMRENLKRFKWVLGE